nr:winged helix-turn-helix domain-containing protein [Haloarchaeobius iranensis]
MTVWDDRILEYIREKEGAAVGEISDSEGVRVSQPTVSRRCQKLAEHGLLTPLGNGVYVITDEGIAYLDEEYDAEAGAYMNAGEQNGPTASGQEKTNG